MIGSRDVIQDPLVVTCTFLVNNVCATILFDSGAHKSFITPKFRKLLSHKSSRLNQTYVVEMGNGQAESTEEILENYILTQNNHAFHVNLMPTTIQSFDILTVMDWLSPHRAEILCYKKFI